VVKGYGRVRNLALADLWGFLDQGLPLVADIEAAGGDAAAAGQAALRLLAREAGSLPACLEKLAFADELVVVCDKCTDGTRAIAESFGARIVEGSWDIEGDRRNEGIKACSGDWILEVDADEHGTRGRAGGGGLRGGQGGVGGPGVSCPIPGCRWDGN